MKQFNIPPQLIINLDETGVPIVPVSQWTLEETGSTSVPITVLDKKKRREIAALLACTVCGDLLDPQLLYQGTTERCHPPPCVNFLEVLDIGHSSSHWSSHDTVRRYVLKILKPKTTAVKAQLILAQVQRGLVLLNVYKAHYTADFLDEFKVAGFELEYVPGNCSSELQPLDLSVNGRFKDQLKDAFTNWIENLVASAIQGFGDTNTNQAVAAVQPHLRLSNLKPIHARWMIDVITTLKTSSAHICQGWEAAGTLAALQKMLMDHTQPNNHEQYSITGTATTLAPVVSSEIQQAVTHIFSSP